MGSVAGTLMSVKPLGCSAVLVEVLAVYGTGRFAATNPGDVIEVALDVDAFAAARRAGVEVLSEVSVRLFSAPAPGELFTERIAAIAPVATPAR